MAKVSFYHGTSGPMEGALKPGTYVTPNPEYAHGFAVDRSFANRGDPHLYEIVTERSNLRGSGDDLRVIDPSKARYRLVGTGYGFDTSGLDGYKNLREGDGMAKKPKNPEKTKPKGGKNPSRPASKADSRGLKGIFNDEYAKRNPKPRPPSEGVPPKASPPPPNSKMLARPAPPLSSGPNLPLENPLPPNAPIQDRALEALARKYGTSMVPEGIDPFADTPLANPRAAAPAAPGAMAALGPLAGMIGAGMMMPSESSSPQELEEEQLMGLIGNQQGVLGGGPQSSAEMNALIQQAMEPGNAAPEPELYEAIVPGGPGDGGGVVPAAMRADKPTGLSEDQIYKIMMDSANRLNQGVKVGPKMPVTPLQGRGGQAPDDIMTRIMLEEMGR